VSDQLVLVNNDLSVARRAVEAIISAYPSDGFGCRLMAPRAGYFDAVIVEKMFRHHATASISGWDSINGYAREVSRKPYLVALPSAFRRAGCCSPFCGSLSRAGNKMWRLLFAGYDDRYGAAVALLLTRQYPAQYQNSALNV
jgi:hypothetical protein